MLSPRARVTDCRRCLSIKYIPFSLFTMLSHRTEGVVRMPHRCSRRQRRIYRGHICGLRRPPARGSKTFLARARPAWSYIGHRGVVEVEVCVCECLVVCVCDRRCRRKHSERQGKDEKCALYVQPPTAKRDVRTPAGTQGLDDSKTNRGQQQHSSISSSKRTLW